MKPAAARMEFLDSIRGLASVAVLLSHSFIFEWPDAVYRFINLPMVNLAFNGKEAVAMFFVLSGYVLSRPYFADAATGRPARKIFLPSFYARRFTRIWLPWFFVFGLSAAAQFFLFRDWRTSPPMNDWAGGFWHIPLTAENFLRQCLFMEHDPRVQLLNQDWSLGIELKASVLMPLLILLVSGWRLGCLLAVSAGLPYFFGADIFYVSFILGILLARYSQPLLAGLRPQPVVVKVGVLLAGLGLYQAFQILGAGNVSCLMTSLGCGLIILATLASERLQALLHWRPVVFLGRISYSIYLLQFIVILCVLPPWVHWLNAHGITGTASLLPLSLAMSVGGTVLLAALNYRWVEKPCLQLGGWLSKKMQRE